MIEEPIEWGKTRMSRGMKTATITLAVTLTAITLMVVFFIITEL